MPVRAAVYGRDLDRDGWPSVSVVMPIRNEADHLEVAVTSVLSQEYPIDFDICLAVAPSDDGTDEVAAELARTQPRIRVVGNPSGRTPSALNAAIAATTGDIIVRVDGHSVLSPGYIRRAVATMVRTGAVNVGGRQVPQPETPFEEAVATATTSWLGTGGATYRIGGTEGPVDTVYLGVFDRVAGNAVGWFADDLVRNQDYELNIRLRAAGGEVRFDPELWVGYRPRPTWRTLAKQYYEYGFWKAEVARRHPGSLRARQVIPALIGPVLMGSTVLSACGPRPFRLLARLGLAGYASGVAAAAVSAPDASPRRLAGVLVTTHLSWSTGFCRRAAEICAGSVKRSEAGRAG